MAVNAQNYVAKEVKSKGEDSFGELEAMIDAFRDEDADGMETLARLEDNLA